MQTMDVESRVRRLEGMQTYFERTLLWVEQAVMPGFKGQCTLQSVEKRCHDLEMLQQSQKSEIDKLKSDGARLDAWAAKTHDGLKIMSVQIADHKKAQYKIVEQLQTRQKVSEDDIQRVQNAFAAVQNGLRSGFDSLKGVCSPPEHQAGENMLELSRGRSKRRAGDVLGTASKRQHTRSDVSSSKRALFVALLEWIAESEERMGAVFAEHVAEGSGKRFTGFCAGSFSAVAKIWRHECPANVTAVAVCDVFPTGVPVVTTMMDVFGEPCVTTDEYVSHRLGKPRVYMLRVPDAHAYFREVVEREHSSARDPAVDVQVLEDSGDDDVTIGGAAANTSSIAINDT